MIKFNRIKLNISKIPKLNQIKSDIKKGLHIIYIKYFKI